MVRKSATASSRMRRPELPANLVILHSEGLEPSSPCRLSSFLGDQHNRLGTARSYESLDRRQQRRDTCSRAGLLGVFLVGAFGDRSPLVGLGLYLLWVPAQGHPRIMVSRGRNSEGRLPLGVVRPAPCEIADLRMSSLLWPLTIGPGPSRGYLSIG